MFAYCRSRGKRIIIWLYLLSLVFFCSGCTNNNNETLVNFPEKTSVTDCMGQQVEITVPAERIGCLYSFSAHVVYMLGCGSDIVTVSNGPKRDVLLNLLCPEISQTPVCCAHGIINIEEMLKVEPDMVFVQADIALNEAESEKMKKFGIDYLAIDYKNINEQQYAIKLIGQALGADEKARRYNEYYQDVVDRVSAVTATIPAGERVQVYHTMREATQADSNNSLSADWLRTAGGDNVTLDQSMKSLNGKTYASLEQILLWDPDVILANEPGVVRYILSDPKWAPLKAVKGEKVYQLPMGMTRWGHVGGMETPLAILWTAKTLYPGRFAELDMEKETRAFYKEFFNCDLTDEMYARIIRGETMRIEKDKVPEWHS